MIVQSQQNKKTKHQYSIIWESPDCDMVVYSYQEALFVTVLDRFGHDGNFNIDTYHHGSKLAVILSTFNSWL